MWRLKFRASFPLIRTSLVEKISMVNQLNNMDIRCKDMNGESLLLVMRSLDWPHQKAILHVLPKFVIFLSAKDGYNWSISMDGGAPCYMFCLFSISSFCLIKRLDFKERILWKEILRMDMDMSCSPNFQSGWWFHHKHIDYYHASNSVRFSQADINYMCRWKYGC